MSGLVQILSIILPAGAVLFGMYLVVKSFTQKELEKRLVEIKLKNAELVVPIRLQAYERLCLLLERMSPENLIVRVNESSFNSAVFHHRLLSEIREEFNHNLAQQVYVSHSNWMQIKYSIDELIGTINLAYREVDSESKSVELAKTIFELWSAKEQDPINSTLNSLKAEIQNIF